MKPHVICHMLSSVDGRIRGRRWRPKRINDSGLFEKLHDEIGCDAWIVGRVTGQEFAKGTRYPADAAAPPPRENHFVTRNAKAYGVVLDAHGKIVWGRADIGGDPIVAVLTRQVPQTHLAGLRSENVSYLFAGDDKLDLAELLETLNRELGVRRVLLEGGGVANGAFIRAGLVDEINLVICPAIDGSRGAPATFDSTDADADTAAEALTSMRLDSSTILDGGFVWLRYSLGSGVQIRSI
jgi:riboflavin biosynthesis pyrimidine reductase